MCQVIGKRERGEMITVDETMGQPISKLCREEREAHQGDGEGSISHIPGRIQESLRSMEGKR